MVKLSLEDFGVRVGVKVHMISKEKQQAGSVDYQFGPGKVPTKAELDAAVRECLEAFNTGIGATDARLTTLADQGFADNGQFAWYFSDAG